MGDWRDFHGAYDAFHFGFSPLMLLKRIGRGFRWAIFTPFSHGALSILMRLYTMHSRAAR